MASRQATFSSLEPIKPLVMKSIDRLALASESCQVAAFALAGGDLHLAALALEDAENILRLNVEDPAPAGESRGPDHWESGSRSG